MRPDPFGQLMVNGAHMQIHRLAASERPFHSREALIRAHDRLGGQLCGGDIGPDDVDPVKSCFCVDPWLVSTEGERSFGNGEQEMFSYLEPVKDLAHSQSDPIFPLEAVLGPLSGLGNRLQLSLRRREEILTLAGTLRLEQRVAAGDQPFSRKLRTMNF